MGIFSRIGDVVKSNINDLIDRAEDPEKMVKQIILDLQKEVSNATTALGKAKASERIAKRQYDDAVKTSADWEMKAKAALNAGEVDLAKKALSNNSVAEAASVCPISAINRCSSASTSISCCNSAKVFSSCVLLEPAISANASASASCRVTFSSMRLNLSMALEESRPPTDCARFFWVFAI